VSGYFGTDGIRGKAEMFTGDFLEHIVRGLGVNGKRVLIGGDTRESTGRILGDLEKSLENNGAREVGTIEVFPTPGINYVMYALVYDYAIDVTASHNPYTDNGIKIFEYSDNGGVKLSEEGRERIEAELADDSPLDLSLSESSTMVYDERFRGGEYYKKHLREYIARANFDGFNIVMDCANGATGVIGEAIFSEFGANVVTINNDVEYGTRINDGVGSTHLEGLIEKVREGGFSFGVAFDGDGDRCMLIDETGAVVDGDQILAILAEHLKLDKLVATVMANQGLLNWGQEKGIEIVTTDVGDQNVAAEMRARGIQIGGEQRGHIILPGEAMGDGMLTALLVAKAMAESNKPLSGLAATMKKSPQVMLNVPADREKKESFKTSGQVRAILDEYTEKLNSVHGRVLVRPSGTEDLLRITMWGDSQETINAFAEELAKKITEVL